MPAAPVDHLTKPSCDYRRRARRIRSLWPHNPEKTQRAIAQLVAPREIDLVDFTSRKFDWSQSVILGHRSAAARDFADCVALRMVGKEIPWTQRQGLLREAARRKINRFEANLIMAAVQYHLGPTIKSPAAPSSGQKTSRLSVPAIVMLSVAVEAGVLLAICHHLF